MKKLFILFFMMTFVWSGVSLAQVMTYEQLVAYDNNTEVLQPGPTGNPVVLPHQGIKQS